MRPKLVALDIDGTLVHRRGSLPWVLEERDLPSPETLETLRELDRQGVAVVLASGRMYPGVALLHEALGLDTPLICQQGCAVQAPGGEILHQFGLAPDTAHGIVAAARELDLPYEWFTPLRYLVSRENRASEEYARLSGVAAEYVGAPETLGIEPTGVGIISDAVRAPEIHRELARHHADTTHLLDFPTVTVAVSLDANKGHAMELICADLGIERHETAAIGDSVNDAPMLAWAGRGYAVSHADRYATEVADEIIDCTTMDGVTALLKTWLR